MKFSYNYEIQLIFLHVFPTFHYFFNLKKPENHKFSHRAGDYHFLNIKKSLTMSLQKGQGQFRPYFQEYLELLFYIADSSKYM